MKKKILSTGLIILLVFMSLVLTGCGDDNDEGTNDSSKIENSQKQKSNELKRENDNKTENEEDDDGKEENDDEKVSDNIETDENSDILSKKVKVGDYIKYNPGTFTYTSPKSKNGSGDQTFDSSVKGEYGSEIKWRVLEVNSNGTVDIVPESSITSKGGDSFLLDGKDGYNNGVEELENICAIFGKGEHAQSARCMKEIDVYKAIGWDKLASKFGISYKAGASDEEKYKMFLETYQTQNEHNKIKDYSFPDDRGTYVNFSEFTINDKDYDLALGKNRQTTWLANTSKYKGDGYEQGFMKYSGKPFGYLTVNSYYLMTTDDNHRIGRDFNGGAAIRPVVTLKANTALDGGTGDSSSPYILK